MQLERRLFSSEIDHRGMVREHYLARDSETTEVFILQCWSGGADEGFRRIELADFLAEKTRAQAKFRGLIATLTLPD